MNPKPFTLKYQRESKAKLPDTPEYIVEQQTFNFLNTLKPKGVFCYKNEEFCVPNKRFDRRGNPNRILGNDVIGLIQSQNGRMFTIEIKKKSEYDYIMKHYETLRTYIGPDKKKTRFARQIFFNEMIEKYGGIAFFAYVWTQVQERFKQEGIIT